MKVRKLLSLLLAAALTLSLCSCGKNTADASSQEDGSSSGSASTSAQPEPEPEPAPVYTNPLTGEVCQTDLARNRPIAIMLNNLKKALPQAGVSQADVIYELPAEGGITRMMALYQSVEGVGEIGTVRSARDYYVSLALGHDAIFLHAGGSPKAYEVIKSWGVTDLDGVRGNYQGPLFWRDQTRRKNAGLEHSLMTSGETIQKLVPSYSKVRQQHDANYTVGWTFTDDAPAATAQPATELTVRFSGYKTGVFTYSPDTKRYLVSEYDKPYVDANNKQQVSVRNVLVLYTDSYAIKGDEKGRMSVRVTGSGKGLLLRDGTVENITWKRSGDRSNLEFYLENGQRADLGVGTSYINILSSSCKVNWK